MPFDPLDELPLPFDGPPRTWTLTEPRPASGWFKAMRDPVALELLRTNKNAFVLLYVIATRSRWMSGFNRHGLAQGEAFIGDCAEYGLSEREYRTAKQLLEKHGFATFKPTNRGTIASLCDSRVFDINCDPNDGQSDGQPTSRRRTADGQPTTNEEGKKDKKEKNVAEATPATLCSDQEWIAGLKADPAYRGIDVDREHAKASRWCASNRKQLTRRRFENWLNRCDLPLATAHGNPASANPRNAGIEGADAYAEATRRKLERDNA